MGSKGNQRVDGQALWRWSWQVIARTAPLLTFALACAVALPMQACGPQIGDTCERSSDCGTGLSCDLATAGGYCTQTPCRKGECPEGSVCIDFGTETTWCMMRCRSDDTQCSGSHACLSAAASPTTKGAPRCLDGDCDFCGVKPSG